MLRLSVLLVVLTTLTGCLCLPEHGEGVDSDYFDNCWSTAKKNAKPTDTLAPKP
jgi:hypothetical protein